MKDNGAGDKDEVLSSDELEPKDRPSFPGSRGSVSCLEPEQVVLEPSLALRPSRSSMEKLGRPVGLLLTGTPCIQPDTV